MSQRQRRDVDRHANIVTESTPPPAILQRLAQHELRQTGDLQRLLGEGHELVGRDDAPLRVVPTHERFGSDRPAAGDLDLRLIADRELGFLDRRGEIGFSEGVRAQRQRLERLRECRSLERLGHRREHGEPQPLTQAHRGSHHAAVQAADQHDGGARPLFGEELQDVDAAIGAEPEVKQHEFGIEVGIAVLKLLGVAAYASVETCLFGDVLDDVSDQLIVVERNQPPRRHPAIPSYPDRSTECAADVLISD